MKKNVLAFLAAFAISVPAFAAETGWYGFGSFGQTTYDLDNELTSIFTGVGGSVDDKDTGFKIGAGYMFTPNFGLEGGWVDLGKATITVSGPGGTARSDFKSSGLFVAGIVSGPINNQFSVFGKLGFVNATSELSISASGPGFPVPANFSDKATKVSGMLGLGVQYDINRQMGIRAEYELFQALGDSNATTEADASMLSIGVVFRFR